MLVKFSSSQDIEHRSMWLDAEQVRLVFRNNVSPNGGTVLYQQGSDSPIYVQEEIETVVTVLLAGGKECLVR